MIEKLKKQIDSASTLDDVRFIVKKVKEYAILLINNNPQLAYSFVRDIEVPMFDMTRKISGDTDLVLVQNCIDSLDSQIAKAMNS